MISTLFDLWSIRNKANALYRKKKFSLVHCRSYLPGLIGLYMKRKFKIPFLFDMRGFWVDEKIDGNIWNMNNPLFRLIFTYMKRMEKTLFREADAVVSLTHKACPMIHRIMGSAYPEKFIQVIPCCVDVHHFNPDIVPSAAADFWREKLRLNDTYFVLSYLGSLSTWYLPVHMLQFFQSFRKKTPQAIFLIITTEDSKPFLSMADSLGIPRESLRIVSAKRSEVPVLLSLSHASVFFIKPAFSKIASSPTKLGEILSMGLPVICNTGIGDTDEIVLKSETGVICHSFDEEEYFSKTETLHAILQLKSKDEIRSKAIEYFSLEHGVHCYLEVYRKLLHQE